MEIDRELLKGSIEPLLLCIIGQRPMYGYQLIKELERRSGGYFQFKEGTLYPVLHRLEKSGLIRGKWQFSSGGLNRKYYYLTEKGEYELNKKMAEWKSFSTAVNAIFASENIQ